MKINAAVRNTTHKYANEYSRLITKQSTNTDYTLQAPV